MLENCSELKNPCASPRSTIIASGVAGVTSENRQMVSPRHDRIHDQHLAKAVAPQNSGAQKFHAHRAAAAVGIISRPDSHGGSPRPS